MERPNSTEQSSDGPDLLVLALAAKIHLDSGPKDDRCTVCVGDPARRRDGYCTACNNTGFQLVATATASH